MRSLWPALFVVVVIGGRAIRMCIQMADDRYARHDRNVMQLVDDGEDMWRAANGPQP